MNLLISCAVVAVASSVVAFLTDTRRRKLSVGRRSGWSAPIILDVLAFALCIGLVAGFTVALIPMVLSARAIPLSSPITLALACCIVTARFLWREGGRQVQLQRPAGLVCGEFLIIAGACFLAITFIFAPPAARLGLARALGGLSVAAGALLVGGAVRAFSRTREAHRILKRIEDQGEFIQREWISPTPECPNPERWRMLDPQSAEIEVLDLLESLIKAVKPQLILETGTFIGHSAIRMAQALKANGSGRIITVEYDRAVFEKAQQQIQASGLSPWIECRNASSLETTVHGAIDLLFSDSALAIREQEVRHFLPQISARGLVVVHDASSYFKIVRELALRLEAEGLLSVVLLSTPRGLCIAQKREGRT